MVWPFTKPVDADELYGWLNVIYKTVNRKGAEIMAELKDLRDKLTEVEAAVETERAQVADGLAKIAEQAARIAELVAAGSPDVAPEVERLQKIVDDLKADDPA